MKSSLTETIYMDLRDKILNGEISPRDFISENQIASEYKVSKAPAKQALHILTEQGYLMNYPRRGYMVCTYSREEINAMQEIRRCMERLCAQLVVRNASDEEIRSLRVYEGMDTHNLDPRNTINTKFHLRLAQISGNKFFPDAIEPLLIKATVGYIKGDPEIEEYEQIIEALLARDETLAVALVEQNVKNL